MRKILAGFLAIPLWMACSTAPDEIISTGRPIINGVDDLEHEAVVALTDGTGFPFCSGTYVGQRTIVTAGHCFQGGGPTFIYFGQNVNEDVSACVDLEIQAACDRFIEVIAEQVHPDFNINTLQNDFALVRINQDPPGIAPIPFLSVDDGTGFTQTDEGDPISFVGFGVTNGQTQTGGGERLIVDGTLNAVGPDNFFGIGIGADQVGYLQPENVGGPCSGDSGGPLFIERNGVEFLGAVTSFGDGPCVDFGVSGRVDIHDDLIRAFQGEVPPPGEVCNNAADDDGDGFIDCDDPDCDGNAVCNIPPPPENCGNGVDDDEDGQADCEDADCVTFSACEEGGFLGCSVRAIQPSTNTENAFLAFLALVALGLITFRRRR